MIRGNLDDDISCRAGGPGGGEIEASQVAGIGITNQRETTLVWDRATGRPLHRAIVWQDRRTAESVRRLKEAGSRARVTRRRPACCSIHISPATKLTWLLDNVPGAASSRGSGRARLRHCRQLPAVAADRRQAPRHRCDQRLAYAPVQHPRRALGRRAADAVRRSRAMLPEVLDSRGRLRRNRRRRCSGAAIPHLRHRRRSAGGALRAGVLRAGHAQGTYGTGCFALLNTGAKAVAPATGC